MTNKTSQEKNTKKTFHDKWVNNPDLAFSQTLDNKSEIFKWILNRNSFKNSNDLKIYLSNKKRILDAGCGNGRVTALLRKYASDNSEVIGIDIAPLKIAKENIAKSGLGKVIFLKKDLTENLFGLGAFDFIYCQEVLHHTAFPEKTFKKLVKLLTKNGEIAIYVYKRKSPAREYIDDYIRDRISCLPYKSAVKVCEQITELGKALSKKKVKIKIPPVDILDIPGGEYDLQRFIYYFFMKCFWNDDLTFKENVAINFDWYHPQICSRHTIEEVRGWFKKAGLKITQECADEYGITMRGKRP